MSTALDAVANFALTGRLKADGFRKSGRTWCRRSGSRAIQIVNLQGSMFATKAKGRAALNVAIYFPVLAELLGIGALTDTPSEADAHLRRRAAMLKPDGRDTWIEFESDNPASIAHAGLAVLQLYHNVGAPWLDQFSSLRAAQDEFARTRAFWHAAA